MSDIAAFESKIEQQCNIIMKTDSEFWEVRNKAILAIKALVAQIENAPNVLEVLSMQVFRLLKDPVKNMIADLRSQQVRDTCTVLMKLSEISGDHLRHLMREIFQSLFDGIKVPNRVMSGYVDQCIIHIIKHTTFKSGVPILVQEVRDNKSKLVRERSLEYINEILTTWEISDKEADMIVEAVKAGLEDASVRAREISRFAYLNIFQMFPKKAERVKASLHVTLRNRLTKAEEELVASNANNSVISSSGSASSSISSPPRKSTPSNNAVAAPSVRPASAPAAAELGASKVKALSSSSLSTTASSSSSSSSPVKRSPSKAAPSAYSPVSSQGSAHAHSPLSYHQQQHSHQPYRPQPTSATNSDDEEASQASRRVSMKPNISLKSRRQSFEENAVTAIQAMIRGNLTRKQSAHRGFDSENTTEDTTTTNDDDEGSVPILKYSNEVPLPTTPPSIKYTKKYDARGMPLLQTSRSVPSLVSSSPSSHSDDVRDSPSHNVFPAHLVIGASAVIRGKDPVVTGAIRYIGLTQFASGYWVGMELATPSGKNNGTVQGVVYFTCEQNYGLFVRPSQVVMDMDYEASTRLAASSNHSSGSSHLTQGRGQAHNQGHHSQGQGQSMQSIAKQREEFTTLVKTKIFELMTVLNQQLDIVEQVERDAVDNPNTEYKLTTVKEILALTAQEQEINELFVMKAKELRRVV